MVYTRSLLFANCFTYAPPTHTHTHKHRHHLRTIFFPITYDLYFSFSFLRNQISAKSRVRLLPNPISSNEFSYLCECHITAKKHISPKYSLTYAFLISTNYSRQVEKGFPSYVDREAELSAEICHCFITFRIDSTFQMSGFQSPQRLLSGGHTSALLPMCWP